MPRGKTPDLDIADPALDGRRRDHAPGLVRVDRPGADIFRLLEQAARKNLGVMLACECARLAREALVSGVGIAQRE